MNILRLTILFILFAVDSNSQTCVHQNLSKDFNFEVIPIPDKEDLVQIMVTCGAKDDPKKIKTLVTACQGFYLNSFNDCTNVKSYSTNVNNQLPTGDEHDSGNLIVGDFNFDGLEDLAIKNDPGGNGGPLYTYFLQAADNQFYKSVYLTETVQFFPIEINPKKKTMTTLGSRQRQSKI